MESRTINMMNSLSKFASEYWAIGGAGASSLWLLAGKQSAKSNSSAAVFWLSIGVLIALILAAWTAWSKAWGGLALAIILILFGVRELNSVLRQLPAHKLPS
jgi:hypothetical protein